MNIYTTAAFFFLSVIILFIFYRVINNKRSKTSFIYKWMRLGKDNRRNLDYKDKMNSLERKTRLINQTRSEYIKLYKNKLR